jgi:hypothetical protein
MKKLSLLIAVLSTVFICNAQDLNDFKGLQSGGVLPLDFTTSSTDKFKTDLDANQNEDLDKDFFLSTRFFIDELLLSGRVLFNEPLSKYVNKVAKYTLRTEKKLYSELRFYVLKSTTVNAFSTDQGIIFFTTGLMAQLENEAQLAYIIAHEVSHYTENHVRDSYVEKQHLNQGNGKYKRMDYESRISELSIYKKSNELDADKKGIDIYLKSEYAVDEIFSSFEMLLYSYLPFNEVQFDTAFFNTDVLTIPGGFFPDTSNEVSKVEDYDDHGHSHPNIQKRIDAAFDIVDGKTSRGNLKFKISEEEFKKVRNLARFEGLNMLLADREYGKVLYNVFLLQREFPNNRFLDLCYVKSLYGLAKYKNANRYREVTEKPKNIEGESFVLHLFLNDLSREQINVMAYRHANDMAKKYATDPIFEEYKLDMKKELAIGARLDYDQLKSKSYEDYTLGLEDVVLEFDVQDSIAKVEASDLSKYEKIRLKKKLRALEGEINAPNEELYDFYKFGLYDLVANEHLIDDLESLEKEERAREDELENEENQDEGLGIAKLMIVDPVFENYRINNKRNLTKSEDQKVDMANIYTQTYPNLNMETDIIDSKLLTKADVDRYNDIGLIFQWMDEVLNHGDIDMISSNHDQMGELQTKYGTDHFLFTGVFAYKDRHEFSAMHFYGIMFIYTAPLVVVDLLVVHNHFEIVAFSVNAEKDEVEFVTVSDVNLRSTPKVIEAYVYDVLYQINNGGGLR